MAKKINITAQLYAATTDGILADAGQIFDTKKGKFQEQVNEEFEDALEEAITSEETDKVVESIEEGIVHNALRKTKQILTEAEKYQARHNISAITAEEAQKIAQDKINETSVSSPDKLQAVKELSSWLEENPDSAATMNAAIQDNYADIQRLYRGTGIDEYSQFSTGKDYSAGAVVLYDGVLFRFKADHAKGAWDYNEVEEWSEKMEREEKLTELGQQVIYDVSKNNDGATFASLSALLSSENLSTLIPIVVRCGGMSIRFVQSSDNKYVQYLYHGTSTAVADFTNTANWEKMNLEKEVSLLSQQANGIYSVRQNFSIGTYRLSTLPPISIGTTYRIKCKLVSGNGSVYVATFSENDVVEANILHLNANDREGEVEFTATRNATYWGFYITNEDSEVALNISTGVVPNLLARVEEEVADNEREISSLSSELTLEENKTNQIDYELHQVSGYDRQSISSSVTNYNMMSVDIRTGDTFFVKANASQDWNRLILCYNGENSNRLFDDSTSTIRNKWIEYTALANIHTLGFGYIDADGQSLSFDVRINGDVQRLDKEIFNIETNIDNIIETEIGPNLCNNTLDVQGAIQSDGTVSISGAWTNYKTSDYIEIDANTSYVFTEFYSAAYSAETGRKLIALFDATKTIISDSWQNVNSVDKLVFDSGSAKFVRITAQNNLLQLRAGTDITPYAEYYTKAVIDMELGTTPLAQVRSSDVLFMKKWAVIGDSFSAWSDETFSNGVFMGERKTYKYFIAERTGIEILDYTLSGRTMAYPNDHTFDNAFAKPSIYQSIPSDVDYITIMLGINDASHLGGPSQDGESTQGSITLGTIDSQDTGTFYGAWNVVLKYLFENYPNAHIGVIVTNGLSSNGPNGYAWSEGQQIYDAELAIVQKWNLPYINLNGGDGKTPMMQRGIYPTGTPLDLINAKWNAFATSPTSPYNGHTNAAGHKYESTFIENFLRSL